MATASAFTMIGFLMVYFLGTFFNWRTVAIICLAVPLLASVAIPFVSKIYIIYKLNSDLNITYSRYRVIAGNSELIIKRSLIVPPCMSVRVYLLYN